MLLAFINLCFNFSFDFFYVLVNLVSQQGNISDFCLSVSSDSVLCQLNMIFFGRFSH